MYLPWPSCNSTARSGPTRFNRTAALRLSRTVQYVKADRAAASPSRSLNERSNANPGFIKALIHRRHPSLPQPGLATGIRTKRNINNIMILVTEIEVLMTVMVQTKMVRGRTSGHVAKKHSYSIWVDCSVRF